MQEPVAAGTGEGAALLPAGLLAGFLPVYLNQKRRPPHGICAAASFLAGMICHFYRECFCSNRSVMLRRLMPRVERLCSMALAAGDRMPSAPRRVSAELKLSHPTKSSLRCVGGIFLFRGRLHLENFRSRPNVIPAFQPTPLQNRGRNFVRCER